MRSAAPMALRLPASGPGDNRTAATGGRTGCLPAPNAPHPLRQAWLRAVLEIALCQQRLRRGPYLTNRNNYSGLQPLAAAAEQGAHLRSDAVIAPIQAVIPSSSCSLRPAYSRLSGRFVTVSQL